MTEDRDAARQVVPGTGEGAGAMDSAPGDTESGAGRATRGSAAGGSPVDDGDTGDGAVTGMIRGGAASVDSGDPGRLSAGGMTGIIAGGGLAGRGRARMLAGDSGVGGAPGGRSVGALPGDSGIGGAPGGRLGGAVTGGAATGAVTRGGALAAEPLTGEGPAPGTRQLGAGHTGGGPYTGGGFTGDETTHDELGTPVVLEGYAVGELLGRGGMGEVLLAHDEVIGREVAIKRMRRVDPDADAVTRFLREAKIQARLQHPAIVPVHELGRDAEGRPYFTMKRLAGVTMHQLLGGPLQRLLRAFADVCLAVEFAHEHGVIHRDIKPTNIMLGDFGEVYVLDWGVARVLDEDGSGHPSVRDIVTVEGETQTGAVMGTPGYMAPEQALGYGVSPAIDVYALGCVLFEILTCQPLHPRGVNGAASAIARPTEAPIARRPDMAIPPELDAACVAALAEDPVKRPTARELAQRVQDYLDGDRDLERRRELAAGQVARAREALASGDPARRGDAVQAAGRALALDPESAEAADLVTSLIIEPPSVLPPALVTSLDDAERAAQRVRSRTAIYAFGAVLAFGAVVPLLEVASWPLLLGFFGSIAGMIGVSLLSYRSGRSISSIALAATFVTALVTSRIAGPFVLTPVVIEGIALGLIATRPLLRRWWIVMVWLALALIVPVALESVGLLAPTWWFDGDTMRIHSAMVHGSDAAREGALIAAHLLFMAMGVLFFRVASRDRRAAERRLHIQAWHLRHLLPERTRAQPA